MSMRRRWLVYGLLLPALLLAVSTALAQSGGGYDLTWNTLDSGAAASGGSYSLSGVAGQPDAGAMSGGGYALTGGFLSGAVVRFDVYLPLVAK